MKKNISTNVNHPLADFLSIIDDPDCRWEITSSQDLRYTGFNGAYIAWHLPAGLDAPSVAMSDDMASKWLANIGIAFEAIGSTSDIVSLIIARVKKRERVAKKARKARKLADRKAWK
jgi:hypothetical protein